jgi:hypothetical protein
MRHYLGGIGLKMDQYDDHDNAESSHLQRRLILVIDEQVLPAYWEALGMLLWPQQPPDQQIWVDDSRARVVRVLDVLIERREGRF